MVVGNSVWPCIKFLVFSFHASAQRRIVMHQVAATRAKVGEHNKTLSPSCLRLREPSPPNTDCSADRHSFHSSVLSILRSPAATAWVHVFWDHNFLREPKTSPIEWFAHRLHLGPCRDAAAYPTGSSLSASHSDSKIWDAIRSFPCWSFFSLLCLLASLYLLQIGWNHEIYSCRDFLTTTDYVEPIYCRRHTCSLIGHLCPLVPSFLDAFSKYQNLLKNCAFFFASTLRIVCI